MADDKKKHQGEPAVEFRWDPLVLAHNKTFSTTIRIEVSGWWPEGRPQQVAVSFYQGGQKPPAGNEVRIQKGHGTFPLTGLEPGHHYHVVCYIEDRTPVHNMITVPELPKPKSPEQESLEREEINLARAKVARQLKQEKKEDKEPTHDEKKIADLNAKTDRVKAEKGFKEAEQALKKVEPPESKRQIKILDTHKRLSKLEVVLQRFGKDSKPEDGGISALDFEQGGIVFGDVTSDFPFQIKNWGIVVVSLPYFDYPRQVTFFLPDDPDVKVIVDVPARSVSKGEERKPAETKSAGQRIAEAWQRGRRGELLAAKDPSKVLPLAAVVGSGLIALRAFKGQKGGGE